MKPYSARYHDKEYRERALELMWTQLVRQLCAYRYSAASAINSAAGMLRCPFP